MTVKEILKIVDQMGIYPYSREEMALALKKGIEIGKKEQELASLDNIVYTGEEFKEMVNRVDEGLARQKEKACRAFCKTTCRGFRDTGRCFTDGGCESYLEFTKAMEE